MSISNSLQFFPITIAIIILAVGLPPRADSIRKIDFKNFDYPWDIGEQPSYTPDEWHWVSSIPASTVSLENGNHRFLEDLDAGLEPNQAPAVRLKNITYGDLDGDKREEAAVDLNYSTGDTNN